MKWIPIILLLIIAFGAFPAWIRKIIFKRDGAVCTQCGKKWSDGWMLHVAHKNHDHSNPKYNDPSNGRLLCIDCHQKDHERLLAKSKNKQTKNQHAYAVRKLKDTDRKRRGYGKGS